ncbi:MAG: NUDIX hydrolase [Nostocaceae cyanobacterium]|nr:NUDIX hydrolase [Nostocaceae cyanobacterium]
MNKLEKWHILQSKMVINDKWCQVRQDEIKLPNGKIINDYFVYIKPDIALVLPITCDGNIVFVKQYRHAVGQFFIELPAGRFDPEIESAEDAAIRELKEETGYIPQGIQKIGNLYDKPSKDTNQIHLFLADNVIKYSEQNLDITEEIEVLLISQASVWEKIQAGEISVAGTIAALFLGLNFFK